MIFSFFFSKMLLGVSDKFSLRFLCLEVELLHRNKSPEKSHKKHLNPVLIPPDFQKMISLWCRKKTRLRRFSTPHSPLQKQQNSPIATVSPGRQFLAAISCLNFLIATCRKTGKIRVFSEKNGVPL